MGHFYTSQGPMPGPDDLPKAGQLAISPAMAKMIALKHLGLAHTEQELKAIEDGIKTERMQRLEQLLEVTAIRDQYRQTLERLITDLKTHMSTNGSTEQLQILVENVEMKLTKIRQG